MKGSGAGRVDERDTVFARMERRPGTPAYEDYYARRPELRAVDDRLRSLPPLLEPGGRHYEAKAVREAARHFAAIGAIRVDEEACRGWARRLAGAPDPTRFLKRLVLAQGAAAVGCAPLDRAFVYTHKGRFDADYGRPVDLDHPSALVFLVEMDHEAMRAAPRAPVLRESARQYRRAARIARVVEGVLRAAGREARAHYDAHYDVMLPPLAVRAGLGEMGRHNLLVADRHGTRVRIGAVTTDQPLRWDRPIDLGVQDFCRACRKCAENCPSHALSRGAKERVRGARKWGTRVERCYAFWRAAGTDCGICMAVCPYSHPDGRFHGLVRRLVRLHPLLRRAARRLDDLVYGRRWRARPDP